MKEKEIERALEIVYCNRDKFVLEPFCLENSIIVGCYIRNLNGWAFAYYEYPNKLTVTGEFADLLYYDNRT